MASYAPMTDQSFPKSHRLLTREQFDRVFEQKCSAADGRIIVYAAANELPQSRIGLVVSRKIGNAVVRNRWKRLLREAFRLCRGELPAEMDYVVLPRKDATPELETLKSSLVQVSRRAGNKLRRQRRAKAQDARGI